MLSYAQKPAMTANYLPAKILLLSSMIFLFSCQKETSFENGNASGNSGGTGGNSGSGGNGGSGGSSGSSNATFYYKATIGGVNYYQDVNATNNYIAGSGLGGTDDVDLSASIDPMTPTATDTASFAVTKGILHNYLSLTNAQFKAFFKPGTYPYTTGPEYDPYKNGDGIYIVWVDKQGNLWSTVDGTGDQTGSSFKIISADDDPDPLTYYVRVKMQFNCKLYKQGSTEMVQLTNGEMVGLFGKI